MQRDALAEARRHALGVGQGDGRGVGVGAVEQHLHRGGAAGAEVGCETGGDGEHQTGRAAGEELTGERDALRAGGEMEVARRDEALHELAALRACVLIDHREGDVAHVPDDRVAEDDEQQEGQGEGEQEAAAIAAELPRLLARHRPEANRVEPGHRG